MPKMTKKDFVFIAHVLKRSRPASDDAVRLGYWMQTVEKFIHSLGDTNPGFDAVRFMASCGAGRSEARAGALAQL